VSDDSSDIDNIVAGFSSELPSDYEARIERQDGELQLFVRQLVLVGTE